MTERKLTRDQLLNLVPSYRTGYLSTGWAGHETLTDQQIVQKLEQEKVGNEAQAEVCGRQDGFEDREKAKKPS